MHYDLQWNRGNVVGLFVLCLGAAVLLIGEGVQHPDDTGKAVAIDVQRVEMAREQIDPNSASTASLIRMSGIGPGRATAIVEFRKLNGPYPFAVPADLMKVHGIGPATVAGIAPDLHFLPVHHDTPKP